MATVTSFAEFLTAIAGSEDIVLANDIDAGDYGYIEYLAIQCNVDGQGHKISNLLIVPNLVAGSSSPFSVNGSKILKNTNFVNLMIKNIGSAGVELFISGSYEKCHLGMEIYSNGYGLTFGGTNAYASCSIKECALDITLTDTTAFKHNSKCSITKSNIVIRGGTFPAFAMTYSTSAVVLSGTQITKTNIGIAGTTNYLALKDCIGSNLAVTANSATTLFCNDGESTIASVTTARQLTPEQLRSESYLREIGFLP